MNWTRLNVPPSDVGQRLDGQRLGQAGDALEQHVAAGEQRDEQALEHRVLADDDALDLVERLLEGVARRSARIVVGGRRRWWDVHVGASFSGQRQAAEPAQGQPAAERRAARARRRRSAAVISRLRRPVPTWEPSRS